MHQCSIDACTRSASMQSSDACISAGWCKEYFLHQCCISIFWMAVYWCKICINNFCSTSKFFCINKFFRCKIIWLWQILQRPLFWLLFASPRAEEFCITICSEHARSMLDPDAKNVSITPRPFITCFASMLHWCKPFFASMQHRCSIDAELF